MTETVAIPVDVLNAVALYLVARPYSEVVGLVQQLRAAAEQARPPLDTPETPERVPPARARSGSARSTSSGVSE